MVVVKTRRHRADGEEWRPAGWPGARPGDDLL